MKNIAVVNLTSVSDYFFKEILELSQINRIYNYCNSLDGVEKIVFLLKESVDGVKDSIIKESWSEKALIKTMGEVSQGFHNIFYFFGDCPLMDSELSNTMLKDHIKYFAEYTFADGYPYGLTPEILDTEILKPLELLSRDSDKPINRESIFNIVKLDINSFELETTIAPKDQRLLRVSLTTDNKRNFNQLQRVIERGGVDHTTIPLVLENSQEILIVEPSYITLDITDRRVQEVKYLPERKLTGDMPIETVKAVVDKIKNYSESAVFSFVSEYEGTQHPDIVDVIRYITENGFDLYIETSGIGWSSELISEFERNEKVKIIVTLDALDKELYRRLRGHGHDEAYAFSKIVIEKARERVWVQAIRMKGNETDMEPFYRYWQEYTENIIIQKYSNYSGVVEDLKVADLSPLKRFPCWHLKRDLHIDREGRALLCINDINSEYQLGSLLSDSLDDIMKNKLNYYREQIKCQYSGICRECDEYYTYNF